MSGYNNYNYHNPSDGGDEYDYYNNPNHENNNHNHNNHNAQYQDLYDYGGMVGGVDANGLPIDIDHVDNMNMNMHDMNMNMNMNILNDNVEDDEEDDEEDSNRSDTVDFDNDPQIANLPRILMMGPRRGGKTSIQRVVFHKMSPHETLFRLEATQRLERSVVDHTPLCRFTIWDFPGDYYGPENYGNGNGGGNNSNGNGHGNNINGNNDNGNNMNGVNNGNGNMNINMNGINGGNNTSTINSNSGNNGIMSNNTNGGIGSDHASGGNSTDSTGHYNNMGMVSQQQQIQQQNQQQMQQQQQSMMMRQPPVHSNNPFQQQNQNNNNNMNQQQMQMSQNNQYQDSGLPTTITTTTETENTTNNQTNEDEGDAYVFGRATALIFVLDAQDEPYDHVLQHFTETVKRAARANPHIAIEVFINKVDGELFLSDEAKYDCRRDVMQQVTDELADAGVMRDSVPISYHLTSIYDHSVFEAFSRVVQKLIPQLPTLENLLNVLVSTCAMEKAYLFDVASKLYISTDSSPVDMQSVELCSDMIDCVLDVSGIYGLAGGSADDEEEDNDDNHGSGGNGGRDIDSSIAPPGSELLSLNSSDPVSFMKNSDGKVVGGGDGDAGGNMNVNVNVNVNTGDDFVNDIGALDYGNDGNDELVGTLISQSAGAIGESEAKEVDADSAFDRESASVIRLSKGMVSSKSSLN